MAMDPPSFLPDETLTCKCIIYHKQTETFRKRMHSNEKTHKKFDFQSCYTTEYLKITMEYEAHEFTGHQEDWALNLKIVRDCDFNPIWLNTQSQNSMGLQIQSLMIEHSIPKF